MSLALTFAGTELAVTRAARAVLRSFLGHAISGEYAIPQLLAACILD